MNKKGLLSNVFIKSAIVLFWCLAIIAFLYAGTFFQLIHKPKGINVLVWGQVLDAEFLSSFEKDSGIRVNVSYLERNEELFVKLKTTKEHGYDLIMSTDYAVELLIAENLIKKIDREKLTFWHTIYPSLLNHYFDPHNDYSIPYFWSLFGLGIDTDCFGGKVPPATWDLVFDKKLAPKRISIVDDARQLILLAAFYLFGTIEAFDEDKIEQIKHLLIKQKEWVELYTDLTLEYSIASKTVPVAVITAIDLAKVMRAFDNVQFVVPREGSFVLIDSFVIPSATKKDEFIYAFLNYIYRPEVIQQYVDKYGFFSSVKSITHEDPKLSELSQPIDALFRNVNFFKNVIPPHLLDEIWIMLKS